MINNFFDLIIQSKNYLLILFLFFLILAFFWQKIAIFCNLNFYNNTHRNHDGEISRLGGFCVYSFLLFFSFSNSNDYNFTQNLLISALPLFLICLKEDLYFNTSPIIRLSSMIVSCIIFFQINPFQFPIIDIPFLNNILNNNLLSTLFFIFSILVLINGMNFIDGLNGLFCFTSIFQLISIIFIASIYDDQEIIVTSIILLIPLLIFLFFNFPFGLIFAGDFGAYFYGFSIALLSLNLFGKYQDLLSWLAVLILFYPCMELLVSFIRKKIFDKKSVFSPDKRHLHTLVSLFLSKKINNNKHANPLTTILLSFFWFLPLLVTYYFYNNIYMILIFIFLFISAYLYFYIFILKKE